MMREKRSRGFAVVMTAVLLCCGAAVHADLVNVAATSSYQYPSDLGAGWPGDPQVWGDPGRQVLNNGDYGSGYNQLVIATNQPIQPMFDLGKDCDIKKIAVFATDTPWASYFNHLSTVSIFMNTEATGQFHTGNNIYFDYSDLVGQADYKIENLVVDKTNPLWVIDTGSLLLPDEYRYIVIRTNSPGSGNNIGINEVEIFSVPEPATLTFLSVGGLTGLVRRRKA